MHNGLWYNNFLVGVNKKAVEYYDKLQNSLESKAYLNEVYVISGKRPKVLNAFLVTFGNAVSTSRHLKGEAIDIIVLDINNDGKADRLF